VATFSIDWKYPFPAPLADFRTDREMVSHGLCADLVGVDGRYTGALRRFPGFRRLAVNFMRSPFDQGFDLGFGYGNNAFDSGFDNGFGTNGITFFKYVEVQKGETVYKLRGFVLQAGGLVFFQYWDTETETWNTYTIDGGVTTEIDVTYGGKFLYYLKEGSQGETIYWLNGALRAFPLGHIGANDPNTEYTTTPYDTNDGLIQVNEALHPHPGSSGYVYPAHYLGVRLVDSRRNVASPMNYVQYTGEVYHGSSYYDPYWIKEIWFTVRPEDTSHYDTIEVYRSRDQGGLMYREIYHHVPTEVDNENATLANFKGENPAAPELGSNGGTIEISLGVSENEALTGTYRLRGTLSDEALVTQKVYDPSADDAGEVPTGSRILYAGGFNMKISDYAQEEATLGEVQWSRLDAFAPETFPAANVYRPPRVSDSIRAFVCGTDSVFGISDSRLFKFTQVGSAMGVERLVHGCGLLNRWAACEVPGRIALVGPSSLVFVEGASGAYETVGIVEQLLQDSRWWGSRKGDIFLVYDATLDGLFIVNPPAEEAVVVWGTSNFATRLKDCNFVAGTSGPHPVSGGPDRTFFITPHGTIVYPDTARENSLVTQLGVSGAVNGIFTEANNTTTLSGSRFDTGWGRNSLRDAYLYVLKPDGTRTRHLITDNTSSTVTVATALGAAVGDRWAISPVPFEVIGWPLSGGEDDPRTPRDLFRRRLSIAIGFRLAQLGGDAGGAEGTTKGLVQLYAGNNRTPVLRAEVSLSTDIDECYGALPYGDPVLLPSFECYAADLDFTLHALRVKGQVCESWGT